MPSRPAWRRATRTVTLVALGLAAWLAAPREAAATFPVLLSARALTPGAMEAALGAGAGNTDPDYKAGWLALRRGFLRSVDLGVRGGYLVSERPGPDADAPLVGIDVRVQVLRESIDIPIDFAVDVAWTGAFPHGRTWSDFAFTGLFGRTLRGVPILEGSVVTLGAELVFLDGTARPGRDDSAAYGVINLEIPVAGRVTVSPEVKIGTDVVYGLAVRSRF